MSDRMRWRYGDTNPVMAAVDLATIIEIDDLLWQDVDDAKPASSQPDQGSNTADQFEFARNFLGVAMQRSRNGDTAPIRVATTGVFEMDCPNGKFELGDLVGVDFQLHGGHDEVNGGKESCTLLDQQVEKVITSTHAIGRVARREAHTTICMVDIRSTVMTGGVVGSTAN